MSWFGTIPSNWGTRPLWTVMYPRKNKNSEGKEQNLLSLSYGRIIRKSIDTVTGLLPESFNGYNIIEKGDIVLRLTDLQNDMRSLRTGLATEHGIITSAYLTLIPKEGYSSSYYHYILHAYDIMKGFYNMGEGIRQGLGYDELSRLPIPVPSPSEQSRIAAFLDERCAKIDEAVSRHKALIEKLDEYRKAVITEAVTKGVRGERDLWSTPRLGMYFKFRSGDSLTSVDISPIKTEQYIYPVYGANGERGYYNKYNLNESRILIGRVGALCGNIHITPINVWVTEHALIAKQIKDINLNFAAYMLEYLDLGQYSRAACQPVISSEQISRVKIMVPSEAEQIEIVDFLDQKCAAIDSAKERHAQLMAKLEEFKKSLIYNAVTGKIEC